MAEVAPTSIRGVLVNLFAICIVIGQLGALLICLALGNRWRWMLGITGFPALLQAIGFIFLIESPGWLFKKGKDYEGFQAINKIFTGSEHDIQTFHQTQKDEANKTMIYQSIGFCKSMVQMCTTYKN